MPWSPMLATPGRRDEGLRSSARYQMSSRAAGCGVGRCHETGGGNPGCDAKSAGRKAKESKAGGATGGKAGIAGTYVTSLLRSPWLQCARHTDASVDGIVCRWQSSATLVVATSSAANAMAVVEQRGWLANTNCDHSRPMIERTAKRVRNERCRKRFMAIQPIRSGIRHLDPDQVNGQEATPDFHMVIVQTPSISERGYVDNPSCGTAWQRSCVTESLNRGCFWMAVGSGQIRSLEGDRDAIPF